MNVPATTRALRDLGFAATMLALMVYMFLGLSADLADACRAMPDQVTRAAGWLQADTLRPAVLIGSACLP